jgi:hypothetical protein
MSIGMRVPSSGILLRQTQFYILLTVHRVMILGNWPMWRTIFNMYLFLFLTLYMFRAHRAHHRERQIVSIQPLVTVTLYRWPEVVLTQFVSPDDEHSVLETCRELKIKIKHDKELCITLVIYQETNTSLICQFRYITLIVIIRILKY